MTRLFDLCFAFFGLVVLSPVLLLLWVIGWLDTGSPLFLQTRVVRNQKPFVLICASECSVGKRLRPI